MLLFPRSLGGMNEAAAHELQCDIQKLDSGEVSEGAGTELCDAVSRQLAASSMTVTLATASATDMVRMEADSLRTPGARLVTLFATANLRSDGLDRGLQAHAQRLQGRHALQHPGRERLQTVVAERAAAGVRRGGRDVSNYRVISWSRLPKTPRGKTVMLLKLRSLPTCEIVNGAGAFHRVSSETRPVKAAASTSVIWFSYKKLRKESCIRIRRDSATHSSLSAVRLPNTAAGSAATVLRLRSLRGGERANCAAGNQQREQGWVCLEVGGIQQRDGVGAGDAAECDGHGAFVATRNAAGATEPQSIPSPLLAPIN